MPPSLSRFVKVNVLKRLLIALLFLSFVTVYCFASQFVFSISSIGIFAILLCMPALVLVWAAPDIEFDWDRLVYPLVLLFITSQIVIPNFYAIPLAGVGWVNLRKVVNLGMMAVVLLTYGLSHEKRQQLKTHVMGNVWIAGTALTFLATIVVSVPLSTSIASSIAALPQVVTAWVAVFFAILSLNRLEARFEFIVKWIVINAVPLATICAIERVLGRRVMFDIMPASMIAELLQSPSFALIYQSSGFRSGVFRAVGSFSVPLSTGEFGAMVVPLALYFLVYAKTHWDRMLGLVGLLSAAAILVTTNARGGLLAACVVLVAFVPIFLLERHKKHPVSLVPALLISFAAAFLPLIMMTDKFRYSIMGGGATASSNDGRVEQFNMALPHILKSPIWGNGFSTADTVIGFNTGAGLTVDSGILSILVDQGLPGALCFVLMLLIPLLQSGRYLFADNYTQRNKISFFVSLSLLAFLANTAVLSQTENFGLMFLEIALYLAINGPQSATFQNEAPWRDGRLLQRRGSVI